MSSESEQTTEAASRGRSWLQVCCIGLLGLIVAFFVGGYFLLRIIAGPASRELTQLPANYPREIELFHVQEAQSIAYAPGKSKGKMMQILSAPARVLASFVGSASSTDRIASQRFTAALEGYSKELESLETVTIHWQPVRATRQEVLAYYSGLFARLNMTVDTVKDEQKLIDSILAKGQGTAVQLVLHDATSTPDLDDLTVTVDYRSH